jgi:hypothetical protein
MHEEMKNAYIILAVKPEGKTLLRMSSHRWEDSTENDIMERLLLGLGRIFLAQDRDK